MTSNYKLLILIVFLLGCKESKKPSNEWVGNNKFIIDKNDFFYLTVGDTVSPYIDKNHLREEHFPELYDTIYVHDTVYKIKYKGDNVKVISNNQSGGVTAKEIINQ